MTPPPVPAAGASIEIARTPDVVRAHFFDLAAAIATQPYHGVTLSWATEGDHEKRARQEIHVLGSAIVDDFIVEEGSDATWVKRFIEGPNTGGRYVARFEATPTGTRVEIVAHAPPHGFSFGLGKLSPLGLEKALRKMLGEHAKAIESYVFEPGSTRAPVVGVLTSLEDLTGPVIALGGRERHALVATLLEAASLVAIADHEADVAEREVMDEIARALCDKELDDETRSRLVKGAERALSADGMTVRCEKLGARLKKLGCAELGLAVATIVAEVSHGIDPPEMAALQKIAHGAGIPDAALASIMGRIDEEMTDALPLAAKKA